MALSVPNGHMAGILAHEVKTPMEAINCIQMVYKDKPKWIKLMITGGVLDATKEGELCRFPFLLCIFSIISF